MATRIRTARITMAQAVVEFLSRQYVELDGAEPPFVIAERVNGSARRWVRFSDWQGRAKQKE